MTPFIPLFWIPIAGSRIWPRSNHAPRKPASNAQSSRRLRLRYAAGQGSKLPAYAVHAYPKRREI